MTVVVCRSDAGDGVSTLPVESASFGHQRAGLRHSSGSESFGDKPYRRDCAVGDDGHAQNFRIELLRQSSGDITAHHPASHEREARQDQHHALREEHGGRDHVDHALQPILDRIVIVQISRDKQVESGEEYDAHARAKVSAVDRNGENRGHAALHGVLWGRFDKPRQWHVAQGKKDRRSKQQDRDQQLEHLLVGVQQKPSAGETTEKGNGYQHRQTLGREAERWQVAQCTRNTAERECEGVGRVGYDGGNSQRDENGKRNERAAAGDRIDRGCQRTDDNEQHEMADRQIR